MTALDTIRETMARYLNENGVAAITAWPEENRARPQGAVAAVSLRACEGENAGFQNYLGERYNQESGRWEELYGRRVTLTFGLDLYAGTGGTEGEKQVRAAFDRMAEALHRGGPDGLKIKSVSCGETDYDRTADRYRCPAEAVCEAFLYAVADEGGTFLEFEVKGAAQF